MGGSLQKPLSYRRMSQASDFTPEQVAQWMLEELRRVRYLYQGDAVFEIGRRFGSQFTYINDNGNDAIDRTVLKAFRCLTGDSVVWERGQRLWRMREKYDEKGRQQC